MNYPEELSRLIFLITKLPGIGSRLATKIALHLVLNKDNTATNFISYLDESIKTLSACTRCGNMAKKNELCRICTSDSRTSDIIMVVEDISSLETIEESGGFAGKYHVLGGTLSPTNGITPMNLNISSFLERLEKEKPKEIIFALNPDLEGEATIMYLRQKIEEINTNLILTKLARGIPTGSDIEFLPGKTLSESIKQRTLFS